MIPVRSQVSYIYCITIQISFHSVLTAYHLTDFILTDIINAIRLTGNIISLNIILYLFSYEVNKLSQNNA